ncbi:MAG: DedA family protein, partial [Snodgrassella alvi]|nr:DedA family protein [Snodgrassella alvi]
AQVQDKFDKYGSRVLFFARFLPGLRTPIYITAGVSGKVSILKFLLMDGLAAMISVPVWVYLGEYGAENIDWLMHKVHQFQAVVYLLIAVGVLALMYYWWKKRQRIQFFKRKIAEIRERRRTRKQQRQDLK